MRQNPSAQRPTWKELRNEVKAYREKIGYDSGQEEANANASIRKSKYNAYEKRQELRRPEKNHERATHRQVNTVERMAWKYIIIDGENKNNHQLCTPLHMADAGQLP